LIPEPSPQLAGSLPRGRHFVPRELVEQNQPQRLFAAVAVAVGEHGYAELSVRKIIRAAGISSATFYELFAGKHEVVAAAYDAIFARLLAEIEAACATGPDWPGKVKAAIAAAVGFATAEPESSRFLCVETFGIGSDRVLASRERLAALLAPGREHCPGAVGLPALTERALVAAIWTTIGVQLMGASSESLAELEPQLVALALTPYLGCEGAARAAARSTD
jgi:AcrR family transcriptional regulator